MHVDIYNVHQPGQARRIVIIIYFALKTPFMVLREVAGDVFISTADIFTAVNKISRS